MCDYMQEFFDEEVAMWRSCLELCENPDGGEDYVYDNMECADLCPNYLLCLQTTTAPSTSTTTFSSTTTTATNASTLMSNISNVTTTTAATTTTEDSFDIMRQHLTLLDAEYSITVEVVVALAVALTLLVALTIVVLALLWRKYQALNTRDQQLKAEIRRSENLESVQLLSNEDHSQNDLPMAAAHRTASSSTSGNGIATKREQDKTRLSTPTVESSDSCVVRTEVELSDRCNDTSHSQNSHVGSEDCDV